MREGMAVTRGPQATGCNRRSQILTELGRKCIQTYTWLKIIMHHFKLDYSANANIKRTTGARDKNN